MEFQTHVAAGRVSEIIGERAIEFDRLQRRRGMVLAAERALAFMNENDTTEMALRAYAAGVNAWIDQLKPARYPVEYKLLDYAPEPWSPLKTALLLKYMAWDLTGRNNEIDLTWILQAHGKAFVDRYYPEHTPWEDPIVPAGKRWRFEPIERAVPESWSPERMERYLGLWDPQPNPYNGSNNWAISGRRTKNRYPMLANDPHLSLRLPSIWYEIQLCGPGQNVYGVSLPGAPVVIAGFNSDIAWGVTNAGSDVYDWYEVEFRDRQAREYLFNDDWREVDTRFEEILVRDGRSFIDTLRMTHHGTVVHYGTFSDSSGDHPVGLAMRWMAHEGSNELLTFLSLNLASNHDDFQAALRHYACPGQNFVFASKSGDIAIQHNGKFPIRYQDQGKFIQDGRDSTHDWRESIPYDQLPNFHNPWRGFVSSANQHPTSDRYPYYLGWDYETFARGARINQQLERMNQAVSADFESLQQDAFNSLAEKVLPSMLARIDTSSLVGDADSIRRHLVRWDYFNDAEAIAPWFFTRWWDRLEWAIWEDELTLGGKRREKPARTVTAQLIIRGRSEPVFDDTRTEPVETLSQLIQSSFDSTLIAFQRDFGAFGETWSLGTARGTDIEHLLGLDGFSRRGLRTSGGPKIVNATGLHFGPSWRMVVSLGPEPKARGIYPGGQSGNPGSYHYDQMVDDWVAGHYYDLLFLPSPEDFPSNQLAGSTLLRNTQ